MKKIFIILMTLCLMVGALCITAFAEGDETEEVVIRVAGLMEDGETVIMSESFTNFKDGWNQAAKLAQNHDWMEENGIDRIVVDLCADWISTNGKFGSGEGFENSTIRVPGGTSITINMNGHKIDRALTKDKKHGEVIFIGKKADLVINGGKNGDAIIEAGKEPGSIKMGTITGGNSYSGAGGIHMDGNGKLTLNNVHLTGNRVEDDHGAAIAAYNSSVVIMNGGSVSKNSVAAENTGWFVYSYGAIFLSNSSAYMSNVEISENVLTADGRSYGTSIYLKSSEMKMENCLISKNGYVDYDKNWIRGYSVIEIDYGALEAINCKFTDNGTTGMNDSGDDYNFIEVYNGDLKMTDCYFENNSFGDLIYSETGLVEVTNTKFANNEAVILWGTFKPGCHFTNCTFTANKTNTSVNGLGVSAYSGNGVTLVDCEWDSGVPKFDKNSKITIVDTDAPNGIGSIFGEGSLTVILAIVAFAALVAAGVSIRMNVSLKKKIYATASTADESEGEATEDESAE